MTWGWRFNVLYLRHYRLSSSYQCAGAAKTPANDTSGIKNYWYRITSNSNSKATRSLLGSGCILHVFYTYFVSPSSSQQKIYSSRHICLNQASGVSRTSQATSRNRSLNILPTATEPQLFYSASDALVWYLLYHYHCHSEALKALSCCAQTHDPPTPKRCTRKRGGGTIYARHFPMWYQLAMNSSLKLKSEVHSRGPKQSRSNPEGYFFLSISFFPHG